MTETRLPSYGVEHFAALFSQDTVWLDVRAPVEFAKGAFPRATNIPLLNDSERERVGRCYRESGQSAAIALGHRLISGVTREQRLQRWIGFVNTHPDVCLYCFRGGLRSQTVQRWLEEEGLVVPRIDGGYKALRRFLLDVFEREAQRLPAVVLAGRTGVGKTLLLQSLDRYIDLEALANHRGSSFGALVEPQPTNIDFENRLAVAILKLTQKPDAPIFLEDEGRLIGRVGMPEALRGTMPGYPAIILETPLDERIDISLDAYVCELQALFSDRYGADEGFERFADHHRNGLRKISKRFGPQSTASASALFEDALNLQQRGGSFVGYRPYIQMLLIDYYDPMYDYQITQKKRPVLMRGSAAEIRAWLSQQTGRWWVGDSAREPV